MANLPARDLPQAEHRPVVVRLGAQVVRRDRRGVGSHRMCRGSGRRRGGTAAAEAADGVGGLSRRRAAVGHHRRAAGRPPRHWPQDRRVPGRDRVRGGQASLRRGLHRHLAAPSSGSTRRAGAGAVDLVVAVPEDYAKQRTKVGVSMPYYISGPNVLVADGKLTEFDDIDRSNKKVCDVEFGPAAELRAAFDIVERDSIDECVTMLRAGEVDGVAGDAADLADLAADGGDGLQLLDIRDKVA